jgi:hypothetical protein
MHDGGVWKIVAIREDNPRPLRYSPLDRSRLPRDQRRQWSIRHLEPRDRSKNG